MARRHASRPPEQKLEQILEAMNFSKEKLDCGFYELGRKPAENAAQEKRASQKCLNLIFCGIQHRLIILTIEIFIFKTRFFHYILIAMNFVHFKAGKDDSGRRFDRIIRRFLSEESISSIYKSLRKGLIKLNTTAFRLRIFLSQKTKKLPGKIYIKMKKSQSRFQNPW